MWILVLGLLGNIVTTNAFLKVTLIFRNMGITGIFIVSPIARKIDGWFNFYQNTSTNYSAFRRQPNQLPTEVCSRVCIFLWRLEPAAKTVNLFSVTSDPCCHRFWWFADFRSSPVTCQLHGMAKTCQKLLKALNWANSLDLQWDLYVCSGARRQALNKQLAIRGMHLPVPLDGELAKRCQNISSYITGYQSAAKTSCFNRFYGPTPWPTVQESFLSNAKYTKVTDQGFLERTWYVPGDLASLKL